MRQPKGRVAAGAIENIRHRRQVAAGEDVLLDKVHTPHVGRIRIIADRDRLNGEQPAGLQPVVANLKKGVQVLIAHGFDHFNRDQLIEGAGELTVVLVEHRNAGLQACLLYARLRFAKLLLGDGCCNHLAAVMFRGVNGHAAPAGADFQQAVRGPQVQFAAQAIELFRGGFL